MRTRKGRDQAAYHGSRYGMERVSPRAHTPRGSVTPYGRGLAGTGARRRTKRTIAHTNRARNASTTSFPMTFAMADPSIALPRALAPLATRRAGLAHPSTDARVASEPRARALSMNGAANASEITIAAPT